MSLNEVYVRTDKNSYTAGDKLLGAVYLNIELPTSGAAVRLKFEGYETYYYGFNKDSGGDIARERVVQDTKDYIPNDEGIIYETDCALPLGKLVIPFQKTLPNPLPGSFQMKSEGDDGHPQWQAQVIYKVIAEIVGEENTFGCQEIIVNERKATFMSEIKCTEQMEVKKFFMSTILTVMACLNKAEYYQGDTIAATVDFTTQSLFKPVVQSLIFKLKRNVVLVLRSDEQELENSYSLPASAMDNNSWRYSTILPHLCASPSSEVVEPSQYNGIVKQRRFVQPENKVVTLWSSTMTGSQEVKLIKGVQNVLIPLRDRDRRHLPETTFGSHVFCGYWVEIDVEVENAKPITLTLPLSFVRRKPSKSKEPSWSSDCTLCLGQHRYSITQDMDADVFENLPVFRGIFSSGMNTVDHTSDHLDVHIYDNNSERASSYFAETPWEVIPS